LSPAAIQELILQATRAELRLFETTL